MSFTFLKELQKVVQVFPSVVDLNNDHDAILRQVQWELLNVVDFLFGVDETHCMIHLCSVKLWYHRLCFRVGYIQRSSPIVNNWFISIVVVVVVVSALGAGLAVIQLPLNRHTDVPPFSAPAVPRPYQ